MFQIKTCQIVIKLYLKDMLLILFNIFMLIYARNKVATRNWNGNPQSGIKILTFPVNGIDLFKLWE